MAAFLPLHALALMHWQRPRQDPICRDSGAWGSSVTVLTPLQSCYEVCITPLLPGNQCKHKPTPIPFSSPSCTPPGVESWRETDSLAVMKAQGWGLSPPASSTPRGGARVNRVDQVHKGSCDDCYAFQWSTDGPALLNSVR